MSWRGEAEDSPTWKQNVSYFVIHFTALDEGNISKSGFTYAEEDITDFITNNDFIFTESNNRSRLPIGFKRSLHAGPILGWEAGKIIESPVLTINRCKPKGLYYAVACATGKRY
ncbi:MAG: hypothetical protein IPL24_18510 [Bacteroidetes bacterium]|nr:hypothetical protein [Bacteroidota bacterium]